MNVSLTGERNVIDVSYCFLQLLWYVVKYVIMNYVSTKFQLQMTSSGSFSKKILVKKGLYWVFLLKKDQTMSIFFGWMLSFFKKMLKKYNRLIYPWSFVKKTRIKWIFFLDLYWPFTTFSSEKALYV